jgi:RNA polymerase sigma-70 factor, ECF subfamily
MNRKSPTWFDGGLGFSRTTFASANSPERSLRTLHSAGISQVHEHQVHECPAHAFPEQPRRVRADSENGRDLEQRECLNFSQCDIPTSYHAGIVMGRGLPLQWFSSFLGLSATLSATPTGATSLQLQSFDEPYVERLRDGDFRTQEHFVAYFTELIQLKLRSRLHSPQAIEDVRQETFARVFAALRSGKLRQPDRLGAFVNSMCNNVLLEQYRSLSRNSPIEEEEQEELPAVNIDVLGALAAKQMGEKVREILDELPERDRRVLREIFLEERDKDEVCRDFGVDRDYLRVLLHRAKLAFKSLYLKHMAARPPGIEPAGKL